MSYLGVQPFCHVQVFPQLPVFLLYVWLLSVILIALIFISDIILLWVMCNGRSRLLVLSLTRVSMSLYKIVGIR